MLNGRQLFKLSKKVIQICVAGKQIYSDEFKSELYLL